jgi:hypothetical protein
MLHFALAPFCGWGLCQLSLQIIESHRLLILHSPHIWNPGFLLVTALVLIIIISYLDYCHSFFFWTSCLFATQPIILQKDPERSFSKLSQFVSLFCWAPLVFPKTFKEVAEVLLVLREPTCSVSMKSKSLKSAPPHSHYSLLSSHTSLLLVLHS